MAGNVIEEFFFGLGFTIQTEKLDEFHKKTEDLKKVATNIGVMMTAVAGGIGLLVQKVAHDMDDLGDFADLHNVSAKTVAAYEKIAKENDSSAEAARSSIRGLTEKLGEAALGVGRGAKIFEALNLSAFNSDKSIKGVDQSIEEVADRMKEMSTPERLAFAAKLGIDESFIMLLREGGDNLKRLREEAEAMNPFSEEDYRLADQVDKLFNKAKGALGIFTKQIGVALMPEVRDVLKGFLDWYKGAKKATSGSIMSGFKMFSNLVGIVGSVLMSAAGAIADFTKSMLSLGSVLPVVGAALGLFIAFKVGTWAIAAATALKTLAATLVATGFAAAALPIAIGLVILALAALAEDYIGYTEGKDSLIGRMIKEFPKLGEALKNITTVLSGWWSVNKAIFDAMYASVSLIVGTVRDLVQGFRELGSLSLDSVKSVLSSPTMNRAASAVNESAAVNAGALPGLPGRGPMGDPFGRTTNNNSTSVTITAPITINSSDPARAGESVSDELRRVARGTTRNGQNPILN